MKSKIKLARTAGILYLLVVIFGLIAQIFVRDHLVDYGNAHVTAKNILASENWYRFGFISELLMLVCDVGVATILYILLNDTSKNLSLLSFAFRLTSITILSITALSHYAAISFLSNQDYLNAFNTDQLDAFALFSIKMHGVGYNICLLFFGIHLLVLGYLLYIAEIFPRYLGVLLFIGGICYILNSIVWFQFPLLVKYIYPAIIIPSAIGEWIFCIWLIVRGIKLSSNDNDS
ncbi:MAG: DUF4386 domain-containing protein [Saprospiraceae bacterium]|nr:DUF4386 domain-containing protein [Saprospiraceae bacterium]MBK9932225.1 DUF4386 domain-containing protein [Saprospiraceae bacterium]